MATELELKLEEGDLVSTPEGLRAYILGSDPKNKDNVLMEYVAAGLGEESHPWRMLKLEHPNPTNKDTDGGFAPLIGSHPQINHRKARGRSRRKMPEAAESPKVKSIWVVVFEPRRHPYRLPEFKKVRVVRTTRTTVRVYDGDREWNQPTEKAWCLPQQADWEKFQRLYRAYQESLDELAAQLRQSERYDRLLKKSKGPNPLTPTVIEINDPDAPFRWDLEGEHQWDSPTIQRFEVERHTPVMLRSVKNGNHLATLAQSLYFACEGDEEWNRTAAHAGRAQQCARMLTDYLVLLGTWSGEQEGEGWEDAIAPSSSQPMAEEMAEASAEPAFGDDATEGGFYNDGEISVQLPDGWPPVRVAIAAWEAGGYSLGFYGAISPTGFHSDHVDIDIDRSELEAYATGKALELFTHHVPRDAHGNLIFDKDICEVFKGKNKGFRGTINGYVSDGKMGFLPDLKVFVQPSNLVRIAPGAVAQEVIPTPSPFAEDDSARVAIASSQIVPTDEEWLNRLEGEISNGLGEIETNRQKVWTAAAEIQRHDLWRVAGHKSFAVYCKARWGWSKSNAYEVADAGRFRSELKESGIPDSDLPTSVSQVRELKRLPPEKRPVVMNAAIAATDGRPTVAAIRAASPEPPDLSLATPEFVSPETPEFVSPETPEFVSPETPEFVSPETPEFVSPETPESAFPLYYPQRVSFVMNGGDVQGNITAVLADWESGKISAVLIEHATGQVQMPLSKVYIMQEEILTQKRKARKPANPPEEG